MTGMGAVMAGIPRACTVRGTALIEAFSNADFIIYTHPGLPPADADSLPRPRRLQPVLAVDAVKNNKLPDPASPGNCIELQGKGILLLGFGRYLTAVEVMPG